MVIQFYDFDFNLLHIQTKVSNITWDIKYNEFGTMQLTLPLSAKILDIIINNKYLVLCHNNLSAIIIGADIQNQITLYGRTCNWILTKRITKKFNNINDTAANIARKCVSEAFSDVANFTLDEFINADSYIDYSLSDNKTTYDVVCDCLNTQNFGHYVNFDYKNKCWSFGISSGRELSLIISEANKNAYDTKWTQDILDMSNCGYFNNSADAFTYVSDENTLTGIYRWEGILNGENEKEALNDLMKKKMIVDMSLCTKKIQYGKDYNLGDIINLQIVKNDFKRAVKKRINGIKIVFENGNHTEQPTFEEV